MNWSGLQLVTDADLGNIEPEATHSSRPWGAASWPHARTEAKRDLKIWLERDFSKDVPNPADRIRDRWKPDWAFAVTSGTPTDITVKVADDNEEDLDLAAALATFGTDRIYVGAAYEFDGLFLKLLDSVNAIASVMTVKYWGANQWTALTMTDGTAASGKTCAQSGRVTWAMPTNWEPRRFNGTADEYFWVEISISAALTAGAALTQLLPLRAPDGLKRVAAYLALGHIFRGLAAQSANPETWLTRARNDDKTGYTDLAEALYAAMKDNGGIPIDLNNSGSIDTPEERQVLSPLRIFRG